MMLSIRRCTIGPDVYPLRRKGFYVLDDRSSLRHSETEENDQPTRELEVP
jgi:hypothetical protein